jgi:anti-sigma B factor antagonist
MPPELGLTLDIDDPDYALLSVEGEVDVYTAPILRQKLVELAETGVSRIIVNLEAVEFLDSTGLGVLVAALNRARRDGGDLELICSGRRILRVFEITGLTKVFTIHESRDAVSCAAPA